MLDNYKNSQTIAYQILKNALKNDKISHAYLIETNENSDGFNFALSFAKSLLCPYNKTNSKCTSCNQCKTIDDNNFIELEIIDTDSLWISKDKIDHLQKNFNMKPIIGKRKVYIIKEAEKLKTSLANTLLKFIEEPEEGIVAILITANRNKIISTILSRCQIISLVNNSKSIKNIDKLYDPEFILYVVKFINYYEKNGIETILNTINLIHEKLNERLDYEFAFNIILLYYNDALNKLLNLDLIYFSNYEKYINEIIKINSIEELLEKIDIVVYLKNLIKYNVNLNLIIDKLILLLKRVDYERNL